MSDLILYHQRVVESYRRGNDCRWIACLAASRIVGRYERGATLNVASDLAISPSQVENLARAGLVYRHMRKFGVMSEIRRALTPSHFAAIGDLIIKYDISPHEAIEQLRTAAENGASVAQMRAYIDGENNDHLPWVSRWSRFCLLARELAEDETAPPNVRRTAQSVMDSVLQ